MLEKFFLKEYYDCPITDIIILENKSYEYANYTELKINNTYIYYTNNNKYGQLYYFSDEFKHNLNLTQSMNDSYGDIYDYKKFEEIKKKEDIKLSIPIEKYNIITKYSSLIFLISIFSFFISYFEPPNPRKINYYTVVNIILDTINLILNIIKFILFIKIKHYYFDYIFPFDPDQLKGIFRIFNFDSFLLSFPLLIILNRFLYIIFPNIGINCIDCIDGSKDRDHLFCSHNKKIRIFCHLLYFMIPYIFYFIYDIVFDFKIKKDYNQLNYNWMTSPIKSIEVSTEEVYKIGQIFTDKNKYFYKWRNTLFKIERISNLNYYNIYNKENGKLCGRDSFGNNLFFPEEIECPINDIIISNKNNEYLEYYKNISLGNNYYLYYTNKKNSSKIIIDLKASYSYNNIQLNLEETNELCKILITDKCKSYYNFSSIIFYREIDKVNSQDFFQNIFNRNEYSYKDAISLNSISYLGVNRTKIEQRGIIGSFKKNISYYMNYLIFLKLVFSLLNIASFIIMNVFFLAEKNKKYQLIISISLIILILFSILTFIISIIINIHYIPNFMNKINNDFEKHKPNLINNFLHIIFGFCLFVASIIITIFNFCFKNKPEPRETPPINQDLAINENLRNNAIIINVRNNDFDSDNRDSKSILDRREVNNIVVFERKNNTEQTNQNMPYKKESLGNCRICRKNPYEMILAPCGHKACCKECYVKLKSSNFNNCPFCQRKVESAIEKVLDLK